MITFEDALSVNRFVHLTKKNKKGKFLEVRRNGRTKVWKTRPNEFKIPIKYGLYEHGYITHNNAHEWSVVKEFSVGIAM